MAEMNYNDIGVAAALGQLAQAQEAMAMRPQKTYSMTTTSSTSTPRALEDMIMRRGMIGANNQRLLDALKKRETFGYNFGSGLANLAPVSGYGDWGVNALRAFGGAMTRPTDAEIAREQAAQEMARKDIETAMAIDKAMGETQDQTQEQTIGYTEMPYSGGKTTQGKGGTSESLGGIQAGNFGRSVGYDPVENLPDFGPVARAALSEEQLGIGKYVPFVQSLAKGVSGDVATQLQSTWSDISDNILSGRDLDFVGKAGGIRVADTPAEQEFIFGPLRNYQNMSRDQLKTALKQSRNNFVASGLNKARQAGVDVSENELKTWWNSAFSVPEGLQTKTMRNVQDKPKPEGPVGAMIQQAKATQKQNIIKTGDVVNGFRFKGGNPNDKNNWEKVQ